MIIVLLGYMASGKSSIGRLLAKKLNYQFQDLDAIIEAEEGQTISDIFKDKGEIYFRKREAELLQKVLNDSQNIVLALGGGTPCYGGNMEFVSAHPDSVSLCLKASIPTLIERLKNETQKRPLIAHLSSDEELAEFIGKHLFERTIFYEQADQTIMTDGLSENEILEKILLQLFQ